MNHFSKLSIFPQKKVSTSTILLTTDPLSLTRIFHRIGIYIIFVKPKQDPTTHCNVCCLHAIPHVSSSFLKTFPHLYS